MHALLEFIVGLIALLAAATLAPLGIDLDASLRDREVSRVSARDCDDRTRSPSSTLVASRQDC